MNSFLPPSVDGLPIDKLSAVFNPRFTTTSYKFFWFLGILDEVKKWGQSEYSKNLQYTPLKIKISDILFNMVLNAWYPLYFNLNLGCQDQLCTIKKNLIEKITNNKKAPLIEIDSDLFLTEINKIDNSEIENETKDLNKYVPYRFLSPWYTDQRNKQVREKTQKEPELMFIYTFVDDKTLQIEPSWLKYLTENLKIVRDFTYWNLCFYLQRRNPHDHFIINKINRVKERKSLKKIKNIWDSALANGYEFECPYSSSNNKIIIGNYDLDHFIPWRYVCNNLMWNLTPAKKEANRSKGDKLPDIDMCLKTFALNQRTLLQYLVSVYGEKLEAFEKGQKKCPYIIYDYLSLGTTITEIANKNDEDLVEFYKERITPLYLQAKSIGFKPWDNK